MWPSRGRVNSTDSFRPRPRWCWCALLALGALPAVLPAAPLTFAADTSRPELSVFVPGEPVTLTFQVGGLTAADLGLKVLLNVVDEQDRSIAKAELPVVADAKGTWQGTWSPPQQRYGFYRVRAKLSNGLELPKLNSRAAGYLTYAVVPDPGKRRLYPQRETFFGMQGGYCPKVNVLPYLGIRWLLGGYGWSRMEPTRAGEFGVHLAAWRKERQQPNTWLLGGRPWQTYPLPTLFFAPKWAVKPESMQYSTGTLTAEGERAWQTYCGAAAKAYQEDYPDLTERIYQITWEPVYPWGFKGTDEDLVRIYQLAYPAIHAVDPQAVVVGPTGAGISRNDVEWNETLLRKGLGKYLDAFAIHPYHAIPPERLGLIERIRELREVIRQQTGRDLDLLGTEQGSPTGEDPSKELDQARGLLRQNLIMMGEGFRLNFAFYIVDYPGEPGYGYFYNLNPKMAWGTDKTAPKPIVPGYAFQSFLLEGHRSAGPIEWLGETAVGYALERGDDVVLALWDWGDAPRTITLPVGVKQVRLYDWVGNEQVVPTPGDTLKLTLGPEPQYVAGVAAGLWGSQAEKAVRLATSRWVGYPGGKVTVAGDVTGRLPADAVVRCELDPRLGDGPAPAKVSADGGKRPGFAFDVTVPADAELGAFPVKVTLAGRDGAVGVAGGMLTVRPPVTVRQVAAVYSATGQPGLRIVLADTTGQAQQGQITARLEGVPETRRTVDLRLPAKGETAVTVPYDGLDLPGSQVAAARLELRLASGYRFEHSTPVNFLPARSWAAPPVIDGELAEWTERPSVALRGRSMLVRSPQQYRGPSDLSAILQFGWDAAGLYLAADVTDDVFVQDQTGFNTWKGDCLQVGLDLDPGKQEGSTGNLLADAGSRHRAGELDLALTTNGPEAYRTITWDKDKLPVRLLTSAELRLAVKRRAGGLRYEAAVPWATLGLAAPPRAGERLGLAVAVNDLDDPKQLDPKALGLFGGITPTKDPRLFGQMVLEGRP